MIRKKRHPLKVTRTELTNRVAKTVGFTQTDVKKVVDAVFDTITEMLAEGKRIEIRRFATFKIVRRNPRPFRNPFTGETIMCPAKNIPVFKPARHVKDKVKAIAIDEQNEEGK